MRIKRIEIIGFKSFCDRSVVNIDDAITAVVGPNGCGKSNIVDAIRWCMGEQSAKHLRGKAMDDVIFAGSESRGPAQMAEVSLTFDDVGFSSETLELALSQNNVVEGPLLSDEDADKVEADGAGGDLPDAEVAEAKPAAEGDLPEGEPAQEPTAEAAPAEDAPAPDAEAAPAEETGEATKAVETFLADKPPSIDFAQYTEVTVTRRLFRDGTSSYLINRVPCRLRDVTDFFLGTGVGTKAYSIIEQGRIGMIVSARPQDRRAIIEEAAGITKFKSKKKAAERKLDQTRQNLLRVSDIVAELAKRMGSLRRQAQKAARYRRYRTEVKDIEMWKASHQYLAMVAEEQVLRVQLVAHAEDLEKTRAMFEKEDAAVIAERAELSVEERRLAGLQETIYELENRIKLSESKVEYQRREAEELDERVAAAHGEIKSLTDRRSEGASQLEQQRAELAELTGQVAIEEKGVSERNEAVDVARTTLAEVQKRLDDARVELSRAQSDLVRAESQRESLARRREESERRLERVITDTDTANERVRVLDKDAKGFDGQLAQLRQTRLDLGAQFDSFESRQSQLEEMVRGSEAEVETLRTELHRRKSRLQSLIEIHDKYEGFARGTRAIMQKSDEITGGVDDAKIRGLVADVVDAPEQLESAVEAALGDRLGGILVNTHEVGLKAISYLKDAGAGRSSFVPYAGASASGIEVEDRVAINAASAATGGEGVLGRLVDMVKFDSGFAEVGQSLLGESVVVDTLDRALELHQQGILQTLVTLDGDIIDDRGVVTGGSREAQGASVLAQKREIRDLEEITGSIESDLADATARFVATKTELQQVSRTIESLRDESHQGDVAIMGHEKDVARCRSELDRLRERVTRLNSEQLELEETIAAVKRDEVDMKELYDSASERANRYEKEQLGSIAAVADGRATLEQLTGALTEAKIRAAQLGEKRASVAASALQLEVVDRELGDRIARLEGSIEDGTTRAEALRGESVGLETELVGMREERRENAELMDAGRSAYEMRVAELQVAEMQVREMRTKAEKLAGEVNNLELSLANLDANRRVLSESIGDRYNLELRKNLGDYHLRPLAGKEEDKRLSELKRLIERMGHDINLTAIEEFEEVSTRHEFLSTQQADLENAVDQLQRAINKINRTSRKMFRDTFASVNATFQEVFPRLFRGGRAKLSLSTKDGQDILESGVEIMAQPPGKKNVTVDQLSGGEKALTAVALIFSIFLIKPSPFCVLDEVDAPLDDANVDRYNEIVREMTDRSQFIVITHNKRTMEIADNLYGVTMQEPGVSKLVNVNINKISNRAEQAA
jgi:chromosome segregation protein